MQIKDVRVGMKVHVKGSEVIEQRPTPIITALDPSRAESTEVEFTGPEWFFPYRTWFKPEELEGV